MRWPNLDEVRGVALAAMALTFNGLVMLEEKGAVSKKDVDDVLVSALLMLENPEVVTEKAAHAARIVLGGFAQTRGIAMRKPS